MKTQLVQFSDRGGITIPKKIREQFPGADVMQIKICHGAIHLEPLHFRDDFLIELERRSRAAKNGKTYSLDEAWKRLDKHHGI